MKTLNIPLDDTQFKKLWLAKKTYEKKENKRYSWQKFLILLLENFELR